MDSKSVTHRWTYPNQKQCTLSQETKGSAPLNRFRKVFGFLSAAVRFPFVWDHQSILMADDNVNI